MLTVRGINNDKSVECIDKLGHFRSVLPERLEVKRRGPRGGKTWEKVA